MELHPEQELPMEVVIPLSSLETAAKVDNMRLALL
jgi:hypothetical protein